MMVHCIRPGAGAILNRGKAVFGAGGVALLIARLAGPAHIGPQTIDGAGHMLANLACKSGAAVVLAAHATFIERHEMFGDESEVFFRFQRETRPGGIIGAAGAASLARRYFLINRNLINSTQPTLSCTE